MAASGLSCGTWDLCHFLGDLPEKAMAPHSSTLAWRIPGMGEPGGLPSMGSSRVRHDWRDLAAAAAGGSSVSVHGLSIKDCRLSCSVACRILVLRPWIEPMSPALQSRYVATGHQGSPENPPFLPLWYEMDSAGLKGELATDSVYSSELLGGSKREIHRKLPA